MVIKPDIHVLVNATKIRLLFIYLLKDMGIVPVRGWCWIGHVLQRETINISKVALKWTPSLAACKGLTRMEKSCWCPIRHSKSKDSKSKGLMVMMIYKRLAKQEEWIKYNTPFSIHPMYSGWLTRCKFVIASSRCELFDHQKHLLSMDTPVNKMLLVRSI